LFARACTYVSEAWTKKHFSKNGIDEWNHRAAGRLTNIRRGTAIQEMVGSRTTESSATIDEQLPLTGSQQDNAQIAATLE